MKAKELQIGDWVRVKVTLADHSSNLVGYKWDAVKVSLGDYHSLYKQYDNPFERYHPIPLTAEILEKNEWKYNKYSETWSPKDMSYYTFALNKKFEWVKKHETYGEEEYIANCNENHLLQHALRLCGLADLADNFTI